MNVLFANDRSGRYPDSWYAATAPVPEEPRHALKGETQADVCIVGAGYTGLSSALVLARAGYDVVVLEAHRAGFGASGRNGGQVWSGFARRPREIEAMVGPADAHALWDLGREAVARVRGLIHANDIDAQWQDGIVYAAVRPRDLSVLFDEVRHIRRSHGYDLMETLGHDAMQALARAPRYRGGVLDKGAGHLHPLRYALGLARAAERAGARIFEQTVVTGYAEGHPMRIVSETGTVRAGHLILAGNGYLGDLAPDVTARAMPLNSFMVATAPLDDPAAVLTERVAVTDSRFFANHFCLTPDNRLLFGGGASFGEVFPTDIAARVRKSLAQTFPHLRDIAIDFAWGGTLAVTRPQLPLLTRVSRHVLSASGYSGHGIALATLAGEILAQTVRGQSERFDVFARIPVPAFPGGPDWRSHLMATGMTWSALRDRLGI